MHLIKIIIAAALCLLSGTASAQITIPDEVKLGKPVVAGCDCIVPENAETRVSWSLESLGAGSGEYVIDSGSDFTVYVWGEPGEYRLSNSVVWVQAEEIEVQLADGTSRKIRSLIDWGTSNYERTFKITGSVPNPDPAPVPNPNPGPKPDPTPGPTPDVPSDQWDLGKTIHAEVMKIPSSARSKASAVADNFDAVSAGIAAGQFRNGGSSAALEELAERNRETLGGDKGAWDPALTALYRHMQERRVPTTLESYADAYTYIARGLRAVK